MTHIPSDVELKERLTPEEYHVLREGGTELPYTGDFLSKVPDGIFVCKVCLQALFATTAKFDSLMGWPAFDEVLPNAVIETQGSHDGKSVTLIKCATCQSYLGTFLENGYTPSRKHYCINSAALVLDQSQTPPPRKTYTLDTEETVADLPPKA